MATRANLSPEMLAQILAGTGPAGYSVYRPGVVKGPEGGGPESWGSDVSYVEGDPSGINFKDPNKEWYTTYGMDGKFLNEGNGKNSLTLKDVIMFAAVVYGMGALSSAFAAAGGASSAAGSSAIGGVGGGEWGALEALGDLSAPGYFTGGTELAGSLANVGAAAPEVVGGLNGAGTFGALEGLGTLGGQAGLDAAAGLTAGAAPGAASFIPGVDSATGIASNAIAPSAVNLGTLGGVVSTAGGLSGGNSLIPGISNDNLLRYGAPLVGGLLQSNAASNASDAQLQASREANALTKGIYDDTVKRNAPFVAGGLASFNAMLEKLGLGGDKTAPGYGSFNKIPTAEDVMAEPGYQFGKMEGQKGLDNKLNAQGMTYSGAALKAASRYNTDYATTKYDGAFNRGEAAKTNSYNRLSGVANQGINASNMTASAGSQYADSAGRNIIGGADAAAANSLAQGNIWTNALNQGVSSYLNKDKKYGDIPDWAKRLFGG